MSSGRPRCSTSTRRTTRWPAPTWSARSSAIHNANTALERFNYLTYLLDWGGSDGRSEPAGRVGTKVNLAAFEPIAADAGQAGRQHQPAGAGSHAGRGAARQGDHGREAYWTTNTAGDDWKTRRVAMAAYLVLSSPDYQVQR
jgi:hypothetical protein